MYLHPDGWLRDITPPHAPDQKVTEHRFPTAESMDRPLKKGKVKYYRFEGYNLPSFNHSLVAYDCARALSWPGALQFFMKLTYLQLTYAEQYTSKKRHTGCEVCNSEKKAEKAPIDHVCIRILPCAYCPNGKSHIPMSDCEYALDKYSWQHTYLHRIGDHGVMPSREFYAFVRDFDSDELRLANQSAVKEQLDKTNDELMSRVAAVHGDLNPNRTVAGGGIQKSLPRVVMPPRRIRGWKKDNEKAEAFNADFASACHDTQRLGQYGKNFTPEFTEKLKSMKQEGFTEIQKVANATRERAKHKRLARELAKRRKAIEDYAESKAKAVKAKFAADSKQQAPQDTVPSKPYTKLQMLAELAASGGENSA